MVDHHGMWRSLSDCRSQGPGRRRRGDYRERDRSTRPAIDRHRALAVNMMRVIRATALALLLIVTVNGQQAAPPLLPFGRSLLHAHNCYPEKGKWADRIERALNTGVSPLVIEQDVALAMRDGKPV